MGSVYASGYDRKRDANWINTLRVKVVGTSVIFGNVLFVVVLRRRASENMMLSPTII